MELKFLFLNLFESGDPVIVGINNISLIQQGDGERGSSIQLNYARSKDLWPKTIYVKQSLEEITTILKSSNT